MRTLLTILGTATLGLSALALGHAPAQARSACGLHCSDSVHVRKVDGLGLDNTVANASCRGGFSSEGTYLCMTGVRGPNSFANAQLDCHDLSAHVANYHDWRYRLLRGDGASAPVGFWLGDITADDTALYVNSTNTGNYDGETSRFDIRSYTCAYYTSIN
jgi:hypothetical protein